MAWREHYWPYGERNIRDPKAAKDTRWFAGKSQDAESKLSYFGARYYDPLLGRFMGIDPVGVDENNVHSHNRYAYANNNPYKFVDPDGNEAIENFLPEGAPVVTIGKSFGALAAYTEGVLTGNEGLRNTAVQGMSENSQANIEAIVLIGSMGRGGGVAGGPRAGKIHTPAANKLGRENNLKANEGELVCPSCGKKMNEPVQSKKGVPIDRDAAVGDHRHPKSQGGDGATVKDMRNHETKCWECNSKKSDY